MSGFEPRKVGAGSLSRRPGKASFLSILGWGIALRWDAGELPSTTPQAEHNPIVQRTKRRSLVRKVVTGRAMPIAGALGTAAIGAMPSLLRDSRTTGVAPNGPCRRAGETGWVWWRAPFVRCPITNPWAGLFCKI